jgi:peptidoglycan/xylan/chitin deacetylase (PgdA/CDA1 family)
MNSKIKRPLSARLPLHYHKIPASIRHKIFKYSVRDRKLCDLVNMSVNDRDSNLSWPNNKKYAVALTHDIDTKKGFQNIDIISKMERKHDVNSCWYIVPKHYKLDYRLLDNLMESGDEIGLHGYRHDNKLYALSEKEIDTRIKSCNEFIVRYNIQGFRAPSFLISEALIKIVQQHFLYDTSIPSNRLYSPYSYMEGCSTVFPYNNGSITELPITLPPDDILLALNLSKQQIFDVWMNMIASIKDCGGLALLVTHPEPFLGNKCGINDVYRDILETLSHDTDVWISTPSKILQWINKSKI